MIILVNPLFQLVNIIFVQLAMLSQVHHQRQGIPTEKPVQKFADRFCDDFFFLDRWGKNMRFAFYYMLDISLFFQSAKQRLDGGVGDIPLAGQMIANSLHRGPAELPNQR